MKSLSAIILSANSNFAQTSASDTTKDIFKLQHSNASHLFTVGISIGTPVQHSRMLLDLHGS
jgi:hypothetical protein